MRYRLLKEMPRDVAVYIICGAVNIYGSRVYKWAEVIGDRDVCRENITIFEQEWAKNIGDIEFMKNSLKASDSVGKGGRTRDKRIKEWNNTYRGTKYEISTI